MNRFPRHLLLSLCFVVLLNPMASFAEEVPTEKQEWQFNLAPFYLWAINIDGDMAAGPIEARVEVPFSDIFDALDTAFVVHLEALHPDEDWGLLFDLNFLDLNDGATLSPGNTIKVDLDLIVMEGASFFRIPKGEHTFDVLLGLRYVGLDNEVTINGADTPLNGTENWTDPFIGGRWIWQIGEKWQLVGRGDIGGFNIGSDFAWQAMGMVQWQPFTNASIIAGYRALDMDYETGSGRSYFEFDATVHGPLLGLNFNW